MIEKWLVLLIIVAVAWYGMKAITRRNKAQQVDEARRRRADAVEDMTACSVCGTYVPQGQRNCGRDGCPYPG